MPLHGKVELCESVKVFTIHIAIYLRILRWGKDYDMNMTYIIVSSGFNELTKKGQVVVVSATVPYMLITPSLLQHQFTWDTMPSNMQMVRLLTNDLYLHPHHVLRLSA